MIVLSPSEWGAQVDYDSWHDAKRPWEGVAIHHGGGGDYPAHQKPYSVDKEMAQLRAWERYHLSRYWTDSQGKRHYWRGLAYNWGIGMTGTVYRARGNNISGAHLGDIDSDGIPNSREIPAVILIMSGERVAPSEAMLTSFAELRAQLETQEGHSLYLWGHKEIQLDPPTICPGRFIMPYIESHREVNMATRIAGRTRYDTAVAGAKAAFPSAEAVYVANGFSQADVGVASSVAAVKGDGPVLYVSKEHVPTATRNEIVRLGVSDPARVFIVGGSDIVSDGVAAELDLIVTGG